MAKELPFFKFEISEWMFGRIQKQPEKIQGMFINLCCKYWHKLGEYDYSDACLDFNPEIIDILIDSRIIGVDSDYIFIKFLDKQLEECAETSKKQSIKGLKSAEIRATRRNQLLTSVQPLLTSVQPNSTEEKRREEKRVKASHAIVPFVKDTYSSISKAFDDLISQQKYIEEDCSRIVSMRGWRSVTPMDIALLLKYFLTLKDVIDRDKSDVRQHFKNWLGSGATQINDLVKISEEGKKSL